MFDSRRVSHHVSWCWMMFFYESVTSVFQCETMFTNVLKDVIHHGNCLGLVATVVPASDDRYLSWLNEPAISWLYWGDITWYHSSWSCVFNSTNEGFILLWHQRKGTKSELNFLGTNQITISQPLTRWFTTKKNLYITWVVFRIELWIHRWVQHLP